MNEEGFQDWLQCVLDELEPDDFTDDEEKVKSTGTFGGADILTNNKGLIVRMENGAVFQLTIVQSEEGAGDLDEDEEFEKEEQELAHIHE